MQSPAITQTLETRTLLAAITATAGTNAYTLNAGDTLTVNGNYDEDLRVTFRGGGDVIVNNGADLGVVRLIAAGNATPGSTSAVFNGGSSADSLEYVGRGGSDALTVRRNAEIGTLIFDASDDRGRTGDGTLRLQGGSTVGTVSYVGSRGKDQLFLSGTVVGGIVDATLFGGVDRVVFGGSAEVVSPTPPASPGNEPGFGQITIDTGSGNDLVDFRGGLYENFTLDAGGGNDRLRFRDASPDDPTTFFGVLDVDMGSGADLVDTPGATNFVFGGTVATGAGNDTLRLENIAGGNTGRGGDITFDLGDDGGRLDAVLLGGSDYIGTVNFNWDGDFAFRETAFNNFRPLFFGKGVVFSGGAAGTSANILFDQFSEARGGYSVTTDATLRLFSNLSATPSSSTSVGISSGGGRDLIRLDGTRVQNTSIFTRGNSDRIEIIDGTFFSGSSRIDTGNGGDIVLFRNSTVGSVDVSYGGGRRSNRLITSGNDVSRLDVFYSGRTIVSEPGGNEINVFTMTEKTGSAANTSLIYDSDDGTFVGDLFIDAINTVRMTFRGTVGLANVQTGAGSDLIFFTGVQINSSAIISSGGGNDFVSIAASAANDAFEIDLGAGDDELDNLFAFSAERSTFDGGAGSDYLAEPTDNATVTNFESFGLDPNA